MSSIFISCALAASSLFLLHYLSLADLPPHCLHGDVVGTWMVHSGQWHPCEDDLTATDQFCGYSIPDNPDEHLSAGLVPPNISSKFKEHNSFNVIFTSRHTLDPDSVDQDTSFDYNDDPTDPTFDWTVVYDEGLDWTFKGRHYFAYFKYLRLKPGEDGTSHKPRARSYCGTTMIGWWRDLDNKNSTGCWWGQKLVNRNNTRVDPNQWTNELPLIRPSLMEVAAHDFGQGPKRAEGVEQLVQRLLQIGSTQDEGECHWKPVSDNFVMIRDNKVTSLQQLNKLMGQPRRFEVDVVAQQAPLRRLLPPHILLHTPQEFDWSNPDHVYKKLGVRLSVIPPTEHQGSCGSCYSLTAARMLTSRLWIQHPSDPQVFLHMHVSDYPMTQCSALSQGCQGGFMFLSLEGAGGRKEGLITQECENAYDAQQRQQHRDSRSFLSTTSRSRLGVATLTRDQQKCFDLAGTVTGSTLQCLIAPTSRRPPPPPCRYRIHVKNHGYIGGPFAHGSEKAMRDALLFRGPFAASIEPTPEFGVYKSGVFHTPIQFTGEYRDGDQEYPWMKVDHAVLVVGFGVDIDPSTGRRMPYWKVQNSWGDYWGENGYFKIVRGINELGIEQSPVEGEPELRIHWET